MKQLSKLAARRLMEREHGKRPAALSESIVESGRAARALTKIGQAVIVRRDDGSDFPTKIRILPWALGHGEWVVGVEGISGGYLATRVRPAEPS